MFGLSMNTDPFPDESEMDGGNVGYRRYRIENLVGGHLVGARSTEPRE